MARGRKLEGEPFAIVKRALEIDPEHVKALALAGTAEFERRDYAAAIGYWERVLKVAPPQSEFARSVAESIAEARTLAGGAVAQKGNQALQGVVSIDPALAARLSPGDTVFVLARPVSGSRMPLAVAHHRRRPPLPFHAGRQHGNGAGRHDLEPSEGRGRGAGVQVGQCHIAEGRHRGHQRAGGAGRYRSEGRHLENRRLTRRIPT